MDAVSVAERIEALLAGLLGPHMARTATRTFCQRGLGIPPEQLQVADVPRLAAALRPALRTLLGAEYADQVLEQIDREFR